MWTKRAIVEQAYAELALSGWVWDLQPEEIQWAVQRLDMLMAQLAARGVNIGYALGDGPDSSDPDQDSGLLTYAIEPISLNLARAIAQGKGKSLQMMPETARRMKEGMDFLYSIAAQPGELQKPYYLPVGAGSKPWRYYWGPFIFDRPQQPSWPPASDKDF